MSRRFYSSALIAGEFVTLRGDEARHVAQVMRLGAGERVVLFDGSGFEFEAEIAEVGRRDVRLRVLQRNEPARELPAPLVVAAPPPKGERLRWMVEKLVELGVSEYVLLDTQRSVVRPDVGTVSKLQRVVIEASKQCGRNRLMRIGGPVSWESWSRECRVVERYFGDAQADRGWSTVGWQWAELTRRGEGSGIALAVGPEGGFTAEESQMALSAGWIGVSLGRRTLRVETAVMAWAAAVALMVDQGA